MGCCFTMANDSFTVLSDLKSFSFLGHSIGEAFPRDTHIIQNFNIITVHRLQGGTVRTIG